MRGLNVGSKPAEWNTSTTTTVSRSTSYVVNFQTTKDASRSTTKSTTTTFSTSKSTTTSWTTSKSTTTTFNTSQSTSKSTTTTFSTSKSTTTSWTTSKTTSQSTTTTFSTTKSTTTTFSTSKSTTTTFNTTKSTTTAYTTTWSTSKSTTTTFSTSKSTTTSWTTSKSTTTTFSTTKSTTTTFSTTKSTTTTFSTNKNTVKSTNTSRTTQKYVSTSFMTDRFTSAGCIVDKQLVHISTYVTTEVSQFGSGSTILEMDTPFNVDSAESYDEMFNVTSSVIDNGGGLQTGSVSEHRIYSASGGIVNINQFDLLITADHPQPVFRSGSWIVQRGEDILIGDGLLNISGSNPTGSFVWVWDIDIDTTGSYVVHDLNTEPHDVFFVNGFLTHNTDFKIKPK